MNKKEMWSLAAKNGLILSLITILLTLISSLFTLPKALSIVITIVKFVGVVTLLYYYMKSYSKDKEFVSYNESFSYGFTLCLCSAIVCTVFNVLLTTVIIPDAMEQSMETVFSMMQSSNVNMQIDYDTMMGLLPLMTALSTLINCLFFGVIEPLIIANWTKKITPFPTTNFEN